MANAVTNSGETGGTSELASLPKDWCIGDCKLDSGAAKEGYWVSSEEFNLAFRFSGILGFSGSKLLGNNYLRYSPDGS